MPASRSKLFLASLGVLAGIAAGEAAEPLVAFRIENGGIAQPLTASPGNPGRGREIVRDQARVTCLICHKFPIPEEPDHGEVGPSLIGIGNRYTAAQLRLLVVDPKAIKPQTIMPSYYRTDGLYRVWEPYRDRPIYTPQEVEDVIAYLGELRHN